MKKYIKSEYILAMALPRKQALKHLANDSEQIKDHVIKCILYADTRQEDTYHWIHDEICSWLEDASEIECKSKLKPKDYLDTVFSAFGASFTDTKVLLKSFRKQYCLRSADPYPDFEITSDLVEQVSYTFQALINICIPYLAKKEAIDQLTWYKLIHKILE